MAKSRLCARVVGSVGRALQSEIVMSRRCV
jgi:hypothetical protein